MFQKPINSSVSYFDCATPGTMPVNLNSFLLIKINIQNKLL